VGPALGHNRAYESPALRIAFATIAGLRGSDSEAIVVPHLTIADQSVLVVDRARSRWPAGFEVAAVSAAHPVQPCSGGGWWFDARHASA
jgi:hypothetical protein